MHDVKSRSRALRSRVALTLLGGLVAGTALWAQTRSQDQDQAQQQPPQGQPLGVPQQPTFRAGVTLITTDVIVRDRNGQFVADLTEDDFAVLEDGVLQEIASLTLVHGGRVYNQLEPQAPVQEGIILPASRPTNDTAGRVFVIFVDDLAFEASRTLRVRQVFREIADTLIHEGDLFGIVSTGFSSIAIDMTYDRALLGVAENRIMGSGLTPTDIIETLEGARGSPELRYRAHVAFKTAYELVTNLEQVENRRKAVIYLSTGYDFNPFPESQEAFRLSALGDANTGRGYNPFGVLANPETAFADSELQFELAELARAANRANASFYAIDPRGLVAGPDIGEKVQTHEWNQYVVETQNSLRALAELTGGVAVVNRNDFGDALKRIDAETSDYYVLGYYTNNPDPTVRTRIIDITVDRDDITVAHRGRYSLPLPPAPEAPDAAR